MKSIVAALVLLLQLHPVVGSVACLGRATQPDCQMPGHSAVPHSTVDQTESGIPDCPLASFCAPSPSAILSPRENLESAVALHSESPIMETATLFGVSSAPPFHPPRA
jgi:hypothetical protein